MPQAHRPRHLRTPAAKAAILMILLFGPILGAGAARAQAVVGEPTDLPFTVRDATTGQPATPERMTIEYVMGRLNVVADMKPGSAAFTAPAVPIKDIGQYVITLWHQGVPYWWQKRGAELTAGPVALDVFSVTESLDAVTITGLNVVLRHRETTADLELMVEVTNLAQPQVTVNRGSGTFELQLPDGATDIEASYQRGPDPTPATVTMSGTRAAIGMPLTPGTNLLRLTARAPWDGALDLPVGSNLPIEAWSLLTAPPSVTVESGEMQGPDEQSVPGFVRRIGPALAAGRTFTLRLNSGTVAGEPEPLFTETAPVADPSAAVGGKNGGGRRFPAALAALAVLIIIGAVAVARRGRS